MQIKELECSGCYVIEPRILKDNRGCFVKTYQNSVFQKHGIKLNMQEEYYSISRKGVIRGLHFQTPPKDHGKFVYCIAGSVIDVFVDLRENSPTFKRTFSIELNDSSCIGLLLPKGVAHGFYTQTDSATLVYKTSTEYSPECDEGILWNSVAFDWPDSNPIITDRDKSFVTLDEFITPFSL